MKARIVAVLIALFGTGFCLVRAYSVEPHSAQQSSWTHGEDGYVSEVLTCCWDELDSASTGYVELFQGDTGTGSQYKLDIYEYPSGTWVATDPGRHALQPQSWLRFKVSMEPSKSFTKGKLYEFRFTRGGTDSLEFYWSDGDPYKYGFLATDQPHAGQDLAMRCYGHPGVGGETNAA